MLLIGEFAQQRHEAELAAQRQEPEFAPQQRRQEPEVVEEAQLVGCTLSIYATLYATN
jgi:hypothetical protein